MKLTVKRLFTGCGLFWVVLACFLMYACHPVPSHADEGAAKQNCIAAKDGFGTLTVQCVDGTVTITKSGQTIVCAKKMNGDTACQKL